MAGAAAVCAALLGFAGLAAPLATEVDSDQLDVAGGGVVEAVVTLVALSGAGADDDPPLNRLEKNPPMADGTLLADVTGALGCNPPPSIGAADSTGADGAVVPGMPGTE